MHMFNAWVPARYLVLAIATGAILLSSFAIAAIVTGSYTTGLSADLNLTQLTIPRPQDVVAGDILIANVVINGGGPALSIVAPPGWTLIIRTDNDTNSAIAAYWKMAGTAEPASYSWTISPQVDAAGGISRYQGVDASNPIDAVVGNSGFGKTATTAPITTSAPGAEIITIFAIDAGKSADSGFYFSEPAGMTEQYDLSNTPLGPSTASDNATQAIAGISPSRSSQISGNKARNWVALHMALRPAPVSTLPNGLISFWEFDEISGNVFDSVAGNTLSNNGGAPFVAAKINNGGQTTATASQYFSILDANQSGLDFTSDMSISMWVRFDAFPLEDSHHILLSKWDNGGQRSYEISADHSPSAVGKLYFSWSMNGNAGASEDYRTTPFSPVVGQWYHIVVTYTAATAAVDFYINEAHTTSNGLLTSIHDGTAAFQIGGRVNLGGFAGLGDETFDAVGVWNRALTSTEVTELYNAGAGRQYPF